MAMAVVIFSVYLTELDINPIYKTSLHNWIFAKALNKNPKQ
jgi:hypothetical protein